MRFALSRRFLHTSATRTNETRTKCIELMRATAQPVSVITTTVPSSSPDGGEPDYHGATLSSFTSVAMFPYPIVSFALRTPSRMADILRRQAQSKTRPVVPHMVINLLSSSMTQVAVHFSRPRGEPFGSTPYFLSDEMIPILDGSLGALSCVLISNIPLGEPEDQSTVGIPQCQGSELFLARVLRVEEGHSPELLKSMEKAEELLPLVYHHQRYTTLDPKVMLGLRDGSLARGGG